MFIPWKHVKKECRSKEKLFSIHVVVDFIRLTLGLIFYFFNLSHKYSTLGGINVEPIIKTHSVNIAENQIWICRLLMR